MTISNYNYLNLKHNFNSIAVFGILSKMRRKYFQEELTQKIKLISFFKKVPLKVCMGYNVKKSSFQDTYEFEKFLF